MSVSSTRKLSSFTKLFLRVTKPSRGETASRDLETLSIYAPLTSAEEARLSELALAMRRAALRAREKNIDIEKPIEGDFGL